MLKYEVLYCVPISELNSVDVNMAAFPFDILSWF